MATLKRVKKGSYHVVPHSKGWAVKKSGATRASGVYATQKEAEKNAKTSAKQLKTELFIHSKSGKIRERNSYGKDPHPPKG